MHSLLILSMKMHWIIILWKIKRCVFEKKLVLSCSIVELWAKITDNKVKHVHLFVYKVATWNHKKRDMPTPGMRWLKEHLRYCIGLKVIARILFDFLFMRRVSMIIITIISIIGMAWCLGSCSWGDRWGLATDSSQLSIVKRAVWVPPSGTTPEQLVLCLLQRIRIRHVQTCAPLNVCFTLCEF